MKEVQNKTMETIEQLRDAVLQLPDNSRVFVALSGAPGAGKSTVADALCQALNAGRDSDVAVIVPMDGYHLDNAVLQERNWLSVKGAPHTFDARALANDLERIIDGEQVFVPVFDRALDCSRASAREIRAEHRIILVEGNYLCCEETPWQGLADGFDLHIHLQVPRETLQQRLLKRWIDHDHSPEQAQARVDNNDLPNVDWVIAHNREPDILFSAPEE